MEEMEKGFASSETPSLRKLLLQQQASEMTCEAVRTRWKLDIVGLFTFVSRVVLNWSQGDLLDDLDVVKL